MVEGSSPSEVPAGRTVQVLQQLVADAAGILGCATAVIMFNHAGKTRVIADHGLERRFRSFEFDFRDAPYARDARLIIPDTARRPEMVGIGRALGLAETGCFVRLPVLVEQDYALSLLVYDGKARRMPSKAALARLTQLETVIRDEFRPVAALFTDPSRHVTHAINASDLNVLAEESPNAAALVGQDLTIHSVNARMAHVLGQPAEALQGKPIELLDLPARDALLMFIDKAIKARTSPPELEIVAGESDERKVYAVSIAPLSPVGTQDYFALVSARDVTALDAREHTQTRVRSSSRNKPDPTQAFLLETLVARRSVRERKSVSFLTLRAWRQPVKAFQIKALKALKANLPVGFAAEVAAEIVAEVQALVGAAAFVGVVPMPCGHSADDSCLSLEIARAVGASLGLPVITSLSLAKQRGGSHPRKNATRPAMELGETVTGPVLLVDDVATSGAHIEEAVKLMKARTGAVLAIAWIGAGAA